MSKQINNAPPICYAFDSYIENGNLYIVTKEYSEIQGFNVACNNQIRLSRAKEIVQMLSENIKLLENSK